MMRAFVTAQPGVRMKLICNAAAAAALVIAGSAFAATAEQNYKGTCFACHDTGVSGAPKLGDKTAWAPRIKQGVNALYNSALHGKPGTAMVAKGGNASLSDADVKAIVDYMVSKAK
jgi:cytochrome c5